MIKDNLDRDDVWTDSIDLGLNDVPDEKIMSVIGEHAERLESAGNCVAFAQQKTDGNPASIRGAKFELVAIRGRCADKEYLESMFTHAGHEIRSELVGLEND